MISKLKSFVYRHPFLRRNAEIFRDTVKGALFILRTKGTVVSPNKIVFCSYLGRQYACSPKAIYEYMLQDKRFEDFEFVWVFKEPSVFAGKLPDKRRTQVVKYLSKEFENEMAGAGYWIFNARVPVYIKKRKGQTYIQTWHGTPLKRLGLDVTGYIKGADDIKSLYRSFRLDGKRLDIMLSPSSFYGYCMAGAFGLKGKDLEKIAKLGYPRNDILYEAIDKDRDDIRRKLGIDENAKVILYAPTWRETALDPAKGSTYSNGLQFDPGLDIGAFAQSLPDDTVVLLRTHYFVAKGAKSKDSRVIDVSDYDDINELYICSDILMTDYSSVMFDFAILGRPMVFYMYDIDEYKAVRDWYFPIEDLPGEIIKDEDRLREAVDIALNDDGTLARRSYEFGLKYYPLGGGSSKRVADAILKDRKE